MPTAANTRNLENFWMPFTANRQFKQAPRLLESAQGMYYRDCGRKSDAGRHGGPLVRQCRSWPPRDHRSRGAPVGAAGLFPAFQMGHPRCFRIRREAGGNCAGWRPAPNWTACSSPIPGSEAVDTALKIAIAYQRAIGQGTRTRLIGRERGYHGVGFGGISVGGMVNNRRDASRCCRAPIICATPTICRASFLAAACPNTARNWPTIWRRLVALHGAETIAAVIVEPVAGSTGVLLPPKGYLERLRGHRQKARHPADLRRSDHRLRPAWARPSRRIISASCPTSSPPPRA